MGLKVQTRRVAGLAGWLLPHGKLPLLQKLKTGGGAHAAEFFLGDSRILGATGQLGFDCGGAH